MNLNDLKINFLGVVSVFIRIGYMMEYDNPIFSDGNKMPVKKNQVS